MIAHVILFKKKDTKKKVLFLGDFFLFDKRLLLSVKIEEGSLLPFINNFPSLFGVVDN
jgi:predicted sulfurtransferase